MLESIFIIAAMITMSISAINWRFHFVGKNSTESERFSIYLGLWTITLLILSMITESFGI